MMRISRVSASLVSVIGVSLLGTGCAAPGVRHDPQLTAQLDPVLDRLASKGAVVYARVIELPNRRELYGRNIDKPCTPASNFKLLTSAAGLDMFGADYKVRTYLAMDGDDLRLVGTGDPGTGDPRLAKAAGGTAVTMLDAWAKELERRGIRRIKGDLVYYDGAFERWPQVHPTWPGSWLLHWYAAPVAGLNFCDNCVDITVYPTEAGRPARYEVMPPVQGLKVINDCITKENGKEKGTPSIVKLKGGNIYRISGGCSKKEELKSKPVEDPGAFFADALRTALAARGITIVGKTRRSDTPLGGALPPPETKVVATYETPMRNILARINKNSQNMFAECLCKLTGREFKARQGRNEPGSWANGAEALRAFLKRNRIDDRALAPIDGSGLSPQNRVTTRMLTDVLAVMHARPDAQVFRASLTAAGIDGSLKDRMTDLKGHVFGKTGYIGGVSSVSGYIKTREGKWLAFSIVYNDIPEKIGDDEDVTPYTKLQDEACRVLVDWPNLKPRSTTRPVTAAS
jgi:D-alanyl-D-alanine carboxypeptidase/D-alanyl-D-alanine-endopeptidase (penicillin-binding protein 4)